MHSLVIGGAGFIGSHLVDRLVKRGPVRIYDNLTSTRGSLAHVEGHLDAGRASLVKADALDLETLKLASAGIDAVFHLSANPDARVGLTDTAFDLEQGTIATRNALEAARLAGVPRFFFASSGTVYGDWSGVCREEDLGHLPISLYGAAKLAGEALCSAYSACFGMKVVIGRFGNVVGARATHGCILDFCRKLKENPERLEVLGDGSQSKPYLHVTDVAAGIEHMALENIDQFDFAVFNLAPRDGCDVRSIAKLVVGASPNPSARIEFGTGREGWKGDVPYSRLDSSALEAFGFKVTRTSLEAVELAVSDIAKEVFDG